MEAIIVILLLVIVYLLIQNKSNKGNEDRATMGSSSRSYQSKVEVTEEEYKEAVSEFMMDEAVAPWTFHGGPDPYMMEYIPKYEEVKNDRNRFELFKDLIKMNKELAAKADK